MVLGWTGWSSTGIGGPTFEVAVSSVACHEMATGPRVLLHVAFCQRAVVADTNEAKAYLIWEKGQGFAIHFKHVKMPRFRTIEARHFTGYASIKPFCTSWASVQPWAT